MDRPVLSKQADRPSDEGLMTLSRGLGLGLDPARSAASSSSVPATPAAAEGIEHERAAASIAGSEAGGGQDGRQSNEGAPAKAPADRPSSSASAATTSPNHASSSTTNASTAAGSSSTASSSYQRRMPLSPLSRSLIEDASDADGRETSFVRSPPSTTSSTSTSPPTTKTRPGPVSGFAAHDRSTTRASRPMALPAPPPPPASQNRAAGGQTPLKSPCFVHGNLGHSVTLQDWLERRPQATASERGNVKVESFADASVTAAVAGGGGPAGDNDDEQRPSHVGGSGGKGKGPAGTIAEEEEEGPAAGSGYDTDGPEGESLTRQLAETAVGVREMSKQLGASCRTRFARLSTPHSPAV
jgi:hypothetical protein